jgi:NADPH:quinone reductase
MLASRVARVRAVIADHPGPPDVLHLVELPDPIPGAGEAAVQVAFAAIAFIDTRLRAGNSPGPSVTFPAVLGNGVGGAVVQVGPNVDEEWLGATVVSTTGGRGGYATLALASAGDLHRVPAGVDLDAATALLADGRTAVGLSTAARIAPGDTVVVTAAGGGLGSLLVQLAARAGGRVVALAGNDLKLDLARSLGAAVALNYRDDDWVDQLSAVAPSGIDVAFDGVGGAVSPAITERLNRRARYLPHGVAGGPFGRVDADIAATREIVTIPLGEITKDPDEFHRLVDEALDLAARGDLRPTVGQTFPLADAAAAHAAIEARGTMGKTLLVVT